MCVCVSFIRLQFRNLSSNLLPRVERSESESCTLEPFWREFTFVNGDLTSLHAVGLKTLQACETKQKKALGWVFTGWPLVGNEGINLYIGILGIHSLIPY